MLIHVNGVFRASAWVYGCLGGGGNNFPAIARLDAVLAVVGDYPEAGYGGVPSIVVRHATPRPGMEQ
jgi:hypothetical protein